MASLLNVTSFLGSISVAEPPHMVDLGNDECVFVKKLSISQRDTFSLLMNDKDKNASIRASLVILAACDEHGANIFDEGHYDAIASATAKDAVAKIDIIFAAALDFNDMRATQGAAEGNG